MSESSIKLVLYTLLLASGVTVIWMLGSPWMDFDSDVKSQIITLLGTLAAGAAASRRPTS